MRFLTSAFLAPAALLAASAPAALLAQEVVQALPGTTDADRLAEQMRALAANPRDLNALIAAADLSLSLGDLSGAASMFARAEKVSAVDPRIKAGEGAILVRSERPGEALRYFAQAEAAGYDPRGFAADRGLAYDLIGQQERAQRDYRLALKTRPDDEIVKRYALSLGIAGKRDAALEQLDPLLRKSDRSAWRIRAFVLAMGGDQAGAVKIATTILPPGMAQGLQPFFERLPKLPPADRAFAVHFGEVHASPERIADARLAPNLPQLAPEVQPVALAAVRPSDLSGKKDRRRRGGRDREAAPAVALASNVVVPTNRTNQSFVAAPVANTRSQSVVASQPVLAARTVGSGGVGQPSIAPSYQAATAALAGVTPAVRPPVALASAAPKTVPMMASPSTPAVRVAPTVATKVTGTGAPIGMNEAATIAPASATPTEAAHRAVLSQTPAARAITVTSAVTQDQTTTAAPVQVASTTVAPTPGFTSSPTQPASTSPASTPPSSAVPVSVATPAVTAASPMPGGAVTGSPAPVPAAPSNFTAPPSRAQADSVLARIVAGLSIPAAELGVVEPVKPAPVAAVPPPDTAARVIAEAKAKEERDAAAEKALAAKTAADKRAADRKAATDKKALAAKKLADEKKLAEAKEAAEEKKAARANPERIWVQVAGGAYAGDLPKAYAAVKAKAPTVFGSRGGWSTPLRATNRVLTGPFKSDGEARSFVNQLAKAGVSAFTFTSDAGQAVTKLPAK